MNAKKTVFPLVLASFFLLVSACSSSSGGGTATGGGTTYSKISFSGQVGSTLSGSEVSASAQADTILALPFSDRIGVEDVRRAQEASVAPDGSFSIELSQSYPNYLLILVDTSLARHEQILGYVALSDLDDSLISLPVGNASGDIDAGELTVDGDEAVSEHDLESYTAEFGMTLSELQERARSDDVLKRVKNLYANDHGSQWWETDVHFAWRDTLDMAHNRNTDPYSYAFEGYGVLLWARNYESELPFWDIVNGDIDVAIHPPKNGSGVEEIALADGGTVVGPFANDAIDPNNVEERVVDGETRYYAGDSDFGVAKDGFGVSLSGPGGTGVFGLPMSQGYWTVTRNGSEIAWFDVAVGSPLDEAGNPRVPIPAFGFTTDGSGRVTGFAVDNWYSYDSSSGAYVEVRDMSLIDEAISFAQLYANGPDPSGGGTIDEIQDNVEDRGFAVDADEMDHSWYYGISEGSVPSGAYLMTTLKFEYRAYGVTCGFWLGVN